MRGIEAFDRERGRQQAIEGYTEEHDMRHSCKDLIFAAICYATPEECREMKTIPTSLFKDAERLTIPVDWPFEPKAWKPTTQERDIEKAGALLAAAYDRLQAEKRAEV